MPAVFEPETQVIDASTNDSHIHLDLTAKTRREKLQLTLKPGETDEVSAIGTVYQCAQCNPNGTLEPVSRPSNATYDRSFAQAKLDEVADMKRQLAEQSALLKELMAERKAAKVKPPA